MQAVPSARAGTAPATGRTLTRSYVLMPEGSAPASVQLPLCGTGGDSRFLTKCLPTQTGSAPHLVFPVSNAASGPTARDIRTIVWHSQNPLASQQLEYVARISHDLESSLATRHVGHTVEFCAARSRPTARAYAYLTVHHLIMTHLPDLWVVDRIHTFQLRYLP